MRPLILQVHGKLAVRPCVYVADNSVCLSAAACSLTVLQVHGKLAASPSKPEAVPGVGDMLRLIWEAAQKPILWYLTLMGFLVGAAARL